jgi:hypothetical protein
MNRRSRFVEAARRRAEGGVRIVEQFECTGDPIIDQMQTAASKSGLKQLFRATPAQLGRAAVAAARRTKKSRT